MTDEDKDCLKIPNFRLAANYSRDSRRGGSCILIKYGHSFKTLKYINTLSAMYHVECCGIELIEHNIIIICLYRIPGSDIHIFYDKLDSILRKIISTNKNHVILCGDFNINMLTKSNQSIDFENVLSGYNLTLQIREPTRIPSNTCIDNFAHNIKNCKSEVIELGLSDHTAQILKCPVTKTCLLKKWQIKRRDYCLENMEKFKNCLQNLTFSDIILCNDPNIAYDKFLDSFKCLYDLCFPYRLFTRFLLKKTKWVSRGIKICSKVKRSLLWKCRKNPSVKNKHDLKTYSKKLRLIINLTQRSQNKIYINNANNKSKATWHIINKSKYDNPKEPITRIIKDNIVISNPYNIANAFNDFYIEQTNGSTKNNQRNPFYKPLKCHS
ncbi:hypothetical protein O3G_MSEX000387 [Manduca sexta]|nr:hypothetical protein O3G_MSEX000387 [Manduca sexta]